MLALLSKIRGAELILVLHLILALIQKKEYLLLQIAWVIIAITLAVAIGLFFLIGNRERCKKKIAGLLLDIAYTLKAVGIWSFFIFIIFEVYIKNIELKHIIEALK